LHAGTFIDDQELTPLEASTMTVGQSIVFGTCSTFCSLLEY
jgi:hypothetical protein